MTPIIPGDWFRVAFNPELIYVHVVELHNPGPVVEFWYHGRLYREWTTESRLREPDVTPTTAEEGEAAWLIAQLTA